MFQDGSDRVPTDSPRTLSFHTGAHPQPGKAKPGHTVNSPPSTASPHAGARAIREEAEANVPRSNGRPPNKGTVTPNYPKATRPPFPKTSDCRPTGRGALLRESAPSGARTQHALAYRLRNAPRRALGRVESPKATLRSHQFASERFHVLLNSLFKVLFNFPSRYLSAIGLVSVFSLRWSLPPTLGCIPKQPDSEDVPRCEELRHQRPDTRHGKGPDQEDSDRDSTHQGSS